MKLTPHEKKILELVRKYPQILDDHAKRTRVAEKHGYTEKTLRNRIGDLKKYGAIGSAQTLDLVDIDDPLPQVVRKDQASQVYEINLLDSIHVLVKHRFFILITILIFAVTSVCYSLLIPKWYWAKAVILPPEDSGELNLGNALSNLPFGGFGILNDNTESSIYLAILKSRTMAESLIDSFNLIEYYEVENIDEAIEKLNEYSWFTMDDEGTISANFIDKNSDFVAVVANYYISELDQINKRLAGERARNNRIFIEKRVTQVEKDLKDSQEKLKLFQEKYGIIALDVQTEEAIRAASQLKAFTTTLEVEIVVMKTALNEYNPELKNKEKQLSELKKTFEAMKFGELELYSSDLFQPFSEVPDIGMEYARLVSDIKIQSSIYEFLLPQYEQAKIQEAKDTPTIQILDWAAIPLEKYKPQRILIVLVTTFFGVIISILSAFVINYVQFIKAEGGTTYRKIEMILAEFKRNSPKSKK